MPNGIQEREEESKQLSKYISDHQSTKQSRIIYINGVPGSGKTLTTKHVLSSKEHIYYNCGMLKAKSRIY